MTFSANDLKGAISLRSFGRWRLLLIPFVAIACFNFTGCTSQQEDDVLLALQGALSNLTQNRALIEQFGRDVQSQIDKQDPQYPELMEQYEEARDAYNQYLDATKQSALGNAQSDEVDGAARAVRNTSARFIANAARALAPNTALRGVAIRNAIDLPAGLPEALKRIPKRERKLVVEKYMQNLHVRSWGTLTGESSRELE
jgi:hypothetical protein